MKPSSYGEAFADVYDSWYTDISDVPSTVATLIELGNGGSFLELGIGTGRIALPLAEAGATVHGIDASPAMLRKLADKPGAAKLHVTCADMADLPVVGPFDCVFAAFNTFFNLQSRALQVRCLSRIADVLRTGDLLALELFVPSDEPDGVEEAETTRPDGVGGTVNTLTTRDPVEQTVYGVHVHEPVEGEVTRRPWTIRYAHPAQLDAMCDAEGLVLAHRWRDWTQAPFDPDSERHVSVYRKEGVRHRSSFSYPAWTSEGTDRR